MIKIDFNDKNFPEMLKKIKNPPKRLYIEGNIDILNDYAIAVIGSRDCSSYGERWCNKFVKGLLEYNLIIVSGMAKGIDTIAHNTALQYGGKTIAVLPGGFNNIYPKENLNLYKKIINSNCLVISEYSPETSADSYKFLERNRIVSGLSIATLVVEAEYRSGTSVTARITREQGKKVFCIPGSLENGKSMGTNILIQNGAQLVISPDDIARNFDFLKKFKLLKVEPDCKEEYKDIFGLLSDIPLDLNDLVKKSNLKVNEIMAKITMLELDGKIKRISGNRFIRI